MSRSLLRRSRRALLSAALSYINRLNFFRGRPTPLRGTRTVSSVCSINLASWGVAEVTTSPRGKPSPSATTISFVPFPRFVLPIPAPLFLPTQKFRRQKLRPNSNDRGRRASQVIYAICRSKDPALAIRSFYANRYFQKESVRAYRTNELLSDKSTKCLQDRLDWARVFVRLYWIESVRVITAQFVPIVYPLIPCQLRSRAFS